MKLDKCVVDDRNIVVISDFLKQEEVLDLLTLKERCTSTRTLKSNPLEDDKIPVFWMDDLDLFPNDIFWRIQKLSLVQFPKIQLRGVKLRSYFNHLDENSVSHTHRDFDGKIRCLTAVLILVTPTTVLANLRFYDDSLGLKFEVPPIAGTLVLFDSDLLHSQSMGKDKISLVLNFM